MTRAEQDRIEVLTLFQQYFGFPNTYLVLDTETTGFSHDRDFFVELGWAVVRNHEIVHREGLILDWSQMDVDHRLIQEKLAAQRQSYAEKGMTHNYTWERLRAEGVHPLAAIHAYATLIHTHLTRGDSCIVGHGFWRFDRHVLDSHTQQYLDGYLLPWQSNSIIDTGLVEKATQTGQFPYPNESLDEWLERVNNKFAKVKWNLSDFCAKKYDLATKEELDRLAHTAAFDCELTHRLLSVYRQFRGG